MSKYYMSPKEINDILLKAIKDYNNLDSYRKSNDNINLKDNIITKIYTFYAPKFIANAEEIEQKDARIAELEEDLKMIAEQDTHQEHMENLELKQKIKELEGALLKAVDSFLQYEKGENIKFTKEELQTEAKEFTNFSIILDNKRIAELEKQLAIRDLALEQMMTDYLEDMRLLKYEEPKESIVLYLNKAEKEIKGDKNE